MSFVSPNFEAINYTELPHLSDQLFNPGLLFPVLFLASFSWYQGFYWSVYDRISLLATEEPSKV